MYGSEEEIEEDNYKLRTKIASAKLKTIALYLIDFKTIIKKLQDHASNKDPVAKRSV